MLQKIQHTKPLRGKHQKSEDNDRKVCQKGGGGIERERKGGWGVSEAESNSPGEETTLNK